jgi:hypothetical protein
MTVPYLVLFMLAWQFLLKSFDVNVVVILMEKFGFIILLISIHTYHASHFRGGTISWKPLGGHKVRIKN